MNNKNKYGNYLLSRILVQYHRPPTGGLSASGGSVWEEVNTFG
jgi:hypothetical protein